MTIKKRTMRLTFFLAMLVSLVFAGMASAQEGQAPDAVKTDLLEKGKKVYFKRCVWCHGVEGGGDGPAAERLFTRPRNFIQGTFKIRFTDSGELPLEADLIKTVKNGLPGSAMPAWGEFLGEDEIVAVVNFVKPSFRTVTLTTPKMKRSMFRNSVHSLGQPKRDH